MQTIEARAILSAADRTGGIFSQIAAKIRGMNAAATMANRTTAATGAAAAASSRASLAAGRASMAANTAIVGATARVLGPAAIAYGGAKSFKNFAAADLAITRIGITADGSQEQVAGLGKSMRDLAMESGKSYDEITKGLESLVAGGMDLPQAMPALPAIAKTAQAAGAEVQDMATTTLALNQNLGIATDKMQNAFDILVKGGKAGKFELKDMARYFPSIAPAAVAVGMKGEEGLMKIVAALQTIRAGTGTTEEAATSLQNIFAKMESERTATAFQKMGIDLRKEMGQARKEGKDLLTVFTDLTEKALKGDLSKMPQLFADMEFARGMRAMLSFRDLNKKVMSELKTSAGSTAIDLQKVLETPAIAVDRLSGSFDRLTTSLGNAIQQAGKLFNKDGTSGALNDLAQLTDDIASGEIWDKRKKHWDDFDRDREMKSTQERIDHRSKFLDREWAAQEARKTGRKRPEFDKELSRDRLRMFDLEQQKRLGDMPHPADVTDVNDRWKSLLTPEGPPAPFNLRGRTPMPMSDPRGRHGAMEPMPAVQGLDIASAMKGANVEAKLNGEAEVKGQTEVKVTVEASSELLRIVESVKSAVATMAGKLRANGPGSTGISSPDAAPNTGVGAP